VARQALWLLVASAIACGAPVAAPSPSPSPSPSPGPLAVAGAPAVVAPGIVSAAKSSDVKITFSPDGTHALWGAIGREGGPGGFEIFECDHHGDTWGAPRVSSLSSADNDFDPSFAPDGTGVYFFSNRPGGLGKDDLWYAPYAPATRTFGAPVDLGPGVNTPADEWAPVVSADGQRLLFASDGRGGAGKHDLFVATRGANGAWGDAQNLGPGVNTAQEDFDATFLHDDRTIVLSSGDLEGDEVRLYVAARRGETYAAREPLGPAVNTAGHWTLGPSISKNEPGVLFFSAARPTGPGRMDVYRIPYTTR
jgi:TolB protein